MQKRYYNLQKKDNNLIFLKKSLYICTVLNVFCQAHKQIRGDNILYRGIS